MSKVKKWFKPVLFDVDDDIPTESGNVIVHNAELKENENKTEIKKINIQINNNGNWMKNFKPTCVEDLAVHNKKIQDVEQWLCKMCGVNSGEIMLLSGPVGCGKTATVNALAAKYNIKLNEWITPVDIDMPTEFGDYEYREKQSTKFLDYIIKAANFTSLIDNNSNKVVVVEDIPNTFLRTPSEFSTILQQYKQRAKSPIVFICSDSHTDSKNTALTLFTPVLKEQLNVHHIVFNGVSPTGLKAALKRVSDIISNKFFSMYTTPTVELIDCVVNSSNGDIRSAVLNLHFACLKGGKINMDTSIVEKENKSKTAKKRKQISSKFISLGKDETVTILHGVGRVLNPKVTGNDKFSHTPSDVIEQFLSQAGSFTNFLEENYLSHFSNIDEVQKAASALSTSDFMLAEWRERFCQEYGLYVAVSGLMLANKTPITAWNPVRGPKNMKIKYPSTTEIPLLEANTLYKGKVLVSDFQTYCKIIANKSNET